MKYLIALIISINTALACQVSIPESYVPTFLNPPVMGHYPKCNESEACYCADSVNPWTAELVDNVVVDYIAKTDEVSCELQTEPEVIIVEGEEPIERLPFNPYQDCDDKFIEISCKDGAEAIKNYDLMQVYCAKEIMKIDGKKLIESEVKKAAHVAAKKAEKDAEDLKKEEYKQLKQELKSVNRSELTSNAKTADILMKVLKRLEALENKQ